jgi:hypothetical protein
MAIQITDEAVNAGVEAAKRWLSVEMGNRVTENNAEMLIFKLNTELQRASGVISLARQEIERLQKRVDELTALSEPETESKK